MLTDDLPGIVVGELFRSGKPIDGASVAIPLSASLNAEEASIRATQDAVLCCCIYVDAFGRRQRLDTSVEVNWQPCNLGGVNARRAAFVCPACESCCRVIYFAALTLMCRRCADLTFASQRLPRKTDIERAGEIRMRLGGSRSLLEPFDPVRPPGMSVKKFRQLCVEQDRLVSEGWPRVRDRKNRRARASGDSGQCVGAAASEPSLLQSLRDAVRDS